MGGVRFISEITEQRGRLQSGVGGCWAVGEQHQQQAGGMRSLVLLFHSFMTFALLNLLAARCSRSVPPHRRVSTAVAWISFPLLPLLWIWSFCFACYQAAATRPAQGQRKSPRRRRRPGEQSKREEKQAKKDKQEQESKERKGRKGKESTEDRAQSKEQRNRLRMRRAAARRRRRRTGLILQCRGCRGVRRAAARRRGHRKQGHDAGECPVKACEAYCFAQLFPKIPRLREGASN